MAVMATHVAGAEHFWIAEVIGRRPPTRERPARNLRQPCRVPRNVIAIHERQRVETAEIVAGLTEADLSEPSQLAMAMILRCAGPWSTLSTITPCTWATCKLPTNCGVVVRRFRHRVGTSG